MTGPMNFKTAAKLGGTVLMLLQNEDVRRSLQGASSNLRAWARDRRGQLAASAGSRRGPITMVSDRFGQGSLERRVESLVLVAPEIESIRPDLAAEIRSAESDLRRAVFVAGQMPMAKRLRAQRTIIARLDTIERSLIDAVLAPH